MAKASKDPVETNFTGTINVNEKLLLREEAIVVLRVKCTDSPRKKEKAQSAIWKQSAAIQGGILVEDGSKLANELAEMVAEAQAVDPDQLTIDSVDVDTDI